MREKMDEIQAVQVKRTFEILSRLYSDGLCDRIEFTTGKNEYGELQLRASFSTLCDGSKPVVDGYVGVTPENGDAIFVASSQGSSVELTRLRTSTLVLENAIRKVFRRT